MWKTTLAPKSTDAAAVQATPALCLLLSNPLEVVELACSGLDVGKELSKALSDLLGLGDRDRAAPASHWSTLGLTKDTPLLEAIKWLKAPSWRYPTEVLGLAGIAVNRLTDGKSHTIEEVCSLCHREISQVLCSVYTIVTCRFLLGSSRLWPKTRKQRHSFYQKLASTLTVRAMFHPNAPHTNTASQLLPGVRRTSC